MEVKPHTECLLIEQYAVIPVIFFFPDNSELLFEAEFTLP